MEFHGIVIDQDAVGRLCRRHRIAGALLVVPWLAAPSPPACANPRTVNDADVRGVLEGVRARRGVPAIAAAVVQSDRVVAQAAVGVRKVGDPTPVTVGDRFHEGSNTKSMTATLIAMLVEKGKLSWDTTIGQVFPELVGQMRPEYRDVTLLQLLSHRAGMPSETWPRGSPDWRALRTPVREQRALYVRLALSEPPIGRPGEKYKYANRGYIVAGAMVERVMDEPWESLITRMLFKPLGMRTAGFGGAAKVGKVDQPWPHVVIAGKTIPIITGPAADNPRVLGPAGTVHCSIGDMAKYVAMHVRGEREGSPLLRPESFRKLHTPPFGGDYALGWLVVDREWAGGKALTHAGSNTMNYAVMWLAPERELAVVVATNQGGDVAPEACDDVAGALIGMVH